MITNVRTLAEYYQQTCISLLYASRYAVLGCHWLSACMMYLYLYRAKKIQNKTSINRNVIGDTGSTQSLGRSSDSRSGWTNERWSLTA